MVTTVSFLGKPIDPFQKWTKKMSKIDLPKKVYEKNLFCDDNEKLASDGKKSFIIFVTINFIFFEKNGLESISIVI